jgi:hypothetical protein
MIRYLAICAILALTAVTGYAQSPVPAPPAASAPPSAAAPRAWESLSPQQRQVLQGYQGQWNSLPPERQQALARGSQR